MFCSGFGFPATEVSLEGSKEEDSLGTKDHLFGTAKSLSAKQYLHILLCQLDSFRPLWGYAYWFWDQNIF
jgi:hypothetical protein